MSTFLSEVITGVQLRGRRSSRDKNTQGRVLKGEVEGGDMR